MLTAMPAVGFWSLRKLCLGHISCCSALPPCTTEQRNLPHFPSETNISEDEGAQAPPKTILFVVIGSEVVLEHTCLCGRGSTLRLLL